MSNCFLSNSYIKEVVLYVHSGVFRFSRRVGLFVLILITFFICAEAGTHVLRAVVVSGVPVIGKDKKIVYGLDLVFDICPKDYWIFYNQRMKKLVVDFYGTTIKGKPKVDLSRRGVFKSIKVINTKTKLSLSGKRSNIIIGIDSDPGWHFKAVTVDKRVIHITAWRDISRLTKDIKKEKSVAILYISIIALVSLVTFSAIVIIGNVD